MEFTKIITTKEVLFKQNWNILYFLNQISKHKLKITLLCWNKWLSYTLLFVRWHVHSCVWHKDFRFGPYLSTWPHILLSWYTFSCSTWGNFPACICSRLYPLAQGRETLSILNKHFFFSANMQAMDAFAMQGQRVPGKGKSQSKGLTEGRSLACLRGTEKASEPEEGP